MKQRVQRGEMNRQLFEKTKEYEKKGEEDRDRNKMKALQLIVNIQFARSLIVLLRRTKRIG